MTSEHQSQPEATAEEDLKWPIGFIAMVIAAALYLGLRLVQLAGRAIDWLF